MKLIGLKAYLHYLRPHWFKISLVVFMAVISNVLIAIVPLFVGYLVQTLSESPVDASRGWMYAWILVALSTSHHITWRAFELLYYAFVQKIHYDYEIHLFRAVINKPYPYFTNKLSGKVSSYVTTLTTELREFISNSIWGLTGDVVGTVTIFFILSTLNWQTSVVFVAGIIGMFAVGRYTLAYAMKYEAKATDINSNKNGILIDALANYVSVKTFRAERQEVATIAREQLKNYQGGRKAFLASMLFWTSMTLFVRDLMWPIIILMNVHFFFQGEITIGQLTTLFATVLVFANRIWNGIAQVSQFGQQFARVDEAYAYLFGNDTKLIAPELADRKSLMLQKGLTITGLTFAYPEKPDINVLSDISLSIRRGEKVGIVGRSGGGKSTLTKLLLDFYPIPDGALTVDGQPVRAKDFAHLISYVPQDTALFHRSIADNIAYGADGVTQADIEMAAQQASADEFIQDLPDGYDTMVGERGVKLSGGQRQRIAIARAILQNKPILILDEATSALDSESEMKVQHALNTLWQGKTVIAIAHRLSTLRHMDTIVVMDKGRIIEHGSHDELLAQKGVYAKLWSHQSGGFIEE